MIFYRTIAPVKAMSFDLDDTLYDNGPIIKRAVKGQLDYLHQHYPKTLATDFTFWWQVREELINKNPQLDGKVTDIRKQTIALGLAKCGYPEEEIPAATQATFEHFYQLRSDFKVPEKTIELLERLAQKIPLAAITNGNMDLTRIGIAHVFSEIYMADDYSAKPDTEMYLRAAEKLDVAPKQMLHVGDQWDTDVLGARRAGCSSALFLGGAVRKRPDPLILPDILINSLDELVNLVDQN